MITYNNKMQISNYMALIQLILFLLSKNHHKLIAQTIIQKNNLFLSRIK